MKNLLIGLCLLGTSFITYAQTQGLENIIVEKYYVSDTNDSIGAIGNGDELPVGSVTYRIFADMLPGYKFQAAFGTQDNSGIPLHTLILSTTTSFYNNTDRGHEIPSYSKSNAAQNTTMLDSWFSAGAACTGNYGILKANDGAGGGTNVVNANSLLQNNDPSAGIPLTTADGIYLATPAPSAVTFVNLAQAQNDFDGGPSSSSFSTTNGSWASLVGATGPTADNRVLIGQFTTNGCFQFELNIQIGTPTGGFQTYVAKNPTGNEILLASLTYPLASASAASVSISANPTGPICTGTSVTFTATPTNGGTNPVFQWVKNGVNVGSGGLTYADNSLANSDQISCIMTSNLPCVSGNPDTSNVITMTVNTGGTASVSISANPTGPICSGTSVTFTAAETNGGSNPVYQWIKNGLNVGTGGTTYTDSLLSQNDQVSCEMTSNLICVDGNPDTSNIITMIVNNYVSASVSITSNNPGPICGGTVVKFTAAPVNGGISPSYQWKKNGNNVGNNSPVFSNTSNINNFDVSCIMTSNAECITGNPATSNTIVINVNPAPTVTLTGVGPTTFCAGTNPLILTANAASGLSYQWKKGANIIAGVTSSTYVPSASANYKVIVTNLNGCTSLSNGIAVMVNSLPPAIVTALGPLSFCEGDSVLLQANSGTGLNYQWAKGNNSFIVGETTQNYTATTQGYYKVIVTNTLNGCAKYSFSKHVIVNCRNSFSLEENMDTHLTVNPNPSEGPFNIILNSSQKENTKAQVEILNVLGQTIYSTSEEISNGQLNLQIIPGSEFAKGIYFVKVSLNGAEYDAKLILQ